MQGNKTSLVHAVNKTQQVFYIINRLRTTTDFPLPCGFVHCFCYNCQTTGCKTSLSPCYISMVGATALSTCVIHNGSQYCFFAFPYSSATKTQQHYPMCTRSGVFLVVRFFFHQISKKPRVFIRKSV